MPQVVPFMAGALGVGSAGIGIGAAAGWAAGSAFAATALGGIAVNLLTSVALSALSMAIQGKPKSQVAGIRTDQTLSGGVNPEGFILGRFATNGVLAAPYMSHGHAGKTPNAFLNYVIELAGVPRHTLEGLILNGETVEILSADPHPDYGRRIGGRYEGRAWVKFYNGTQTTADPMLLAKYPAPYVRPWSAAMVGRGICYAILTFQYDREVFTGWPTARFILGGAPLYDPRKDSTAGGAGSQRWDQPETYTQTENLAVIVYNILRGIRLPSGEIWGGDIAAEDLPLPVWTAAMDAADAPEGDGDGGTEPRYRASIEVMAEDEPWSVIDELLKGANGAIAETGGVWTIRLGAPALPVAHITDADLLADSADDFKPFPTLDAIYNGIEATYPDADSTWESREADPIYSEEWEAEDGGRRLVASVALNATPYPVQVARVMAALIKDHRRMRVHVIVLPHDALALEALDVITWTSQTNFYVAKSFEVKKRDLDLLTGRVTLTIREIDPEDYDPPTGLTRPDPPDRRPLLPQVQAVPDWAVTGHVITDGAGKPRRAGLRLSWDAEAADDARGIRWAIRRAGTSGNGEESPITRVQAGEAIVELLPNTAYQARARLIVDRPTEWSDWISAVTPDVRLGQDDLEQEISDALDQLHEWIDEDIAGQIAQEVQERKDEIQQLADEISADMAARVEDAEAAANRWREQRDQIRKLKAEIAELNSRSYTAQESLRREISVATGGAMAGFLEEINVLIGDGIALANRITSLEAETESLGALVEQVEVAMVDGDNALAATIASLAVGSAVQFDHVNIWHWNAGAEGWTSTTTAPSVTNGWLRPAAGTADIVSPLSPALAVNSAAYTQIRARLRCVGSPTWAGRIWWAAEGQPWDAGRRMDIPEPLWDAGIAYLTADLPWTGAGTITRIRLDIASGTDGANYIELDWLAIGRPSPGASSAELQAERQARISGDAAISSDLLALESRLTDAEGEAEGQAEALNGLSARVEDTEDGLIATSEEVTLLKSAVEDPSTGLAGLASAIDNLTTIAVDGDGSQVYQAEAIRALRSRARAAAAEFLNAEALGHLNQIKVQQFVAEASQALGTRIDITDEEVRLIADAVTKLQVAIPNLATASALQALVSEVTLTKNSISATASALTNLKAQIDHPTTGLGAKASGAALSSLQTTVNDQGGVLSSVSDALLSLESAVNNPTTGLGSKLAASVITNYATKAYADSAASSATTSLKSTLEGAGGSIKNAKDRADDAYALANTKASATAVNSLTTRVSNAEGQITSLAESDSTLTAQVGNMRASGLFRVSVEANQSGSSSRIGLKAVATGGAASSSQGAALFLEARSDGTNQIILDAARVAIANGSNRKVPFFVSGGQVYMSAAMIQNASITNAMIGDNLYSNNFVAGSAGWRVQQNGNAEFNSITIRRQIEVASGSLSLSGLTAIAGAETGSGADSEGNGNWARPSLRRFVRTTPIAMGAWQGAQKTYIATAGMTGTVNRISSAGEDVYWGWEATVLPLTRWAGNQSLRLALDFWSRNVSSLENVTITWKIYEVS